MRMIVAHDVADDLGAFTIGTARNHAAFLRGKQNSAMHRLKPVTHIRQGASDDHAHRVIKIARLHFIDNVDALKLAERRGGIENFGVVAHAGKSYAVGGKGEAKALGQVVTERQLNGGRLHSAKAAFPHMLRFC
jgi:hypothetical protein